MRLLIGIGMMVAASIIGAFASLFLKKGSATITKNLKLLIKNPNLFFGVFLYGVGMVIGIPALKFGPLNVLYPINALVYIWTSFLAAKYLGESINKFKIIGIGLIILGVVLITR